VCSFDFILLDVGRNTLDDLVGVALITHGVRVQIARRAQLELCRVAPLAFLDGNFARWGEMLVLIPHKLDEFLQILDFLRLQQKTTRLKSDLVALHLLTTKIVWHFLSLTILSC